jgi:hypothetical protein
MYTTSIKTAFLAGEQFNRYAHMPYVFRILNNVSYKNLMPIKLTHGNTRAIEVPYIKFNKNLS